jgi:hypothetical protein
MSKRSRVQIGFGSVFGALMIAVAVIQFRHANASSEESIAELAADSYLRVIEAMRDVYTSEVVARLPDSVPATYDYARYEHAVPLPATFTILLADSLRAMIEGLDVRLYSRYPFPFRGPHTLDEFERRALEILTAAPDTTVSEVQVTDGTRVLRYARGDAMRPECVTCHNTHPDSPKTDWQVGDLRGVLAVTLPLSTFETSAAEARRPYVLLLLLAIIGFLAALVLLVDQIRSPPGTRRRRTSDSGRADTAKSEAA